MKTKILLSFIQILIIQPCFSQGFINLKFESAITTNTTFNIISAADAFPGWTATAPYIAFNDISLSGGSISIFNTNSLFSYPPIQGKYFALFFGSANPSYGAISLGQTGQIPVGSQSISFWGSLSGMQVTFAGQALNYFQSGSTVNYNIYTADISAYAGQVGQLLFTVPLGASGGTLDNIQFSSSPVPEPSVLVLSAFGSLLLGVRNRKKIKL